MSAAIKLMSVNKGVPSGSVEYTAAGTYAWEAPAGVTSVTLRGRGGSKLTSQTWNTLQRPYVFLGLSCSGATYGATLAWSTVNSQHQSQVSAMNAVTLSSSGASYSGLGYTYFRNYCTTDSTWKNGAYFTHSGTLRRIGTVTANSTMPTSGNVPVPTGSSIYSASGGQIQKLGISYTYGTDSTALGYTFPDDSSEATYTNVSVTPGTTYSLVVGVDADPANQVSFINISWGD